MGRVRAAVTRWAAGNRRALIILQGGLVNNNIWEYAKAEVTNPSLDQRIAHSSTVKGLKKRVSSTSGMASTLRDGASAATGAIPVPVVGSFISAALNRVFSAARAERLKRKLSEVASGNNEKAVKFGLKLLDAGSLDRKRAKIEEAYRTFKAQSTGDRYDRYVRYAMDRGETCHPLLEKAKNIEYALKHIRIMKESAEQITALGASMTAWCESLEEEVSEEQRATEQKWQQNLPKTVGSPEAKNKYHGRCFDTGAYCVTLSHLRGGSPQMNKNVASVVKVVTGSALDAGSGWATKSVVGQIK